MTDRKNQHFVPRCALRPFSLNGEGRAINTYLIGPERPIPNASLKNQCSKDYFYGDDLKVEEALGDLEGQYARVLRALTAGQDLSAVDQEWLRLFVVIQGRRTERAITELATMQERFVGEIFKRAPSLKPPFMSHQELVALSMTAGLEMHERARDLKFIVLRNKTAEEFITSDDPAVETNRFHFDKKLHGGFGIVNSGLLLVLPLTPKLAALFFDIGIYTVSIPRGTHFVDVTNAADVEAINHLQCLNAHKNLYFSSWNKRGAVQQAAADAALARDQTNHEIETLVRDREFTDTVYRRGSADEEAQDSEVLILGSFRHPQPSTWPFFLKYRPKPVTFSNGTAIGYVRKEEWLSGDGGRKSRFSGARIRSTIPLSSPATPESPSIG